MVNKLTLHQLNLKYASEGLDLLKAIRAWKDLQFTPDSIRDQVRNDVGTTITASDARELYHLGSSMKYDYDAMAKPYEVSKGREKLIPDNIKNEQRKLSPAIKMSMERLGQNLYRDKKAKTYWTLKEKVADNGEKAVYLVAIEEPDDVKKTAALSGTSEGTPTSVVNQKASDNPITGTSIPVVEQDNKELKGDIYQVGKQADLLSEALNTPEGQQLMQQYGEPAKKYIQQYGQKAIDAIKQHGPGILQDLAGALSGQMLGDGTTAPSNTSTTKPASPETWEQAALEKAAPYLQSAGQAALDYGQQAYQGVKNFFTGDEQQQQPKTPQAGIKDYGRLKRD
jgi:hypothetical protein